MIKNIKHFLLNIWISDFWYHPIYDTWFPKCHKCKPHYGRNATCPKDCMGDD